MGSWGGYRRGEQSSEQWTVYRRGAKRKEKKNFVMKLCTLTWP